MLVDTASLAAKCPRMEAKGGIHPDKKPDLYKTELCHNWAEMGHCRYGKKCRFAHGAHELRSIRRHARYKTEICRTYHSTGACLYGVRCTFIHEDSDLPRMVDKDSESEDSDTSSSHSSVSGDGDSTITVLTVPLDPTTGRPNDKSFLVDNGTDSLDKLSDAFATHCSLQQQQQQQQQQQCTSFNPLVGYGFNNVNNKAGATPLPPLPSLPFRAGKRERRLAAFASICSSIELENNPWNTNDSGSRRQQFLFTTTSAPNVWSHHPNQRVFLQTK